MSSTAQTVTGYTVTAVGFADDLARMDGFGGDGDGARGLTKAEAEATAMKHAKALMGANRVGAVVVVALDGVTVRNLTWTGRTWAKVAA